MKFRQILMLSAAAGCLSLGLGTAAQAQGAPDGAVAIEEVIVTAQKREQSLQDVPASVTAFSAVMRENSGIVTTQDVMNFTPGVTYSATGDRVSIRGIGRTTNQIGTDPGVAVYQDGFYVPALTNVGGSTLGTARVEVLRGPQGTLYGRNSVGGAVNVISRRPGRDLETEVRVGLNDFSGTSLEGRIAGSLTDSVRGAVMLSKVDQRDGYFHNVAGGPDEGGVVDSFAADLQLAIDLGQNVEGWVRWNYQTAHNHDRTEGLISPYDTRYNIGLVPAPLFGLDPKSNPGLRNPRDFATNRRSTQDLDDDHLLVTQWTGHAPGFDVKYIGGYAQYRTSAITDGDQSARAPFAYPVDFQFDPTHIGSAFSPVSNPGAFDSDLTRPGVQPLTIPVAGASIIATAERKKAFSHEINLTSTTDGPLKWLLGAYYYQERDAQDFDLALPDDAPYAQPYPAAYLPLLAPLFGLTATDYAFLTASLPATGAVNPRHDAFGYQTVLHTQSAAAFAQLDYDLTSSLHVTAGLRYGRDNKRGYEAQTLVAWYPLGIATGQTITTPAGVIPYGGPPIIVNHTYDLSPTPRTLKGSWSMTTGTAGLQWTPRKGTLVYASYGRGAKSGGFNLGTFSLAPVGEETVDAFEVGWKQAFGPSLQVNSAAFHYVYNGMQVPNQVVPAPGVSLPVLVNVGEVESNGVELEAQWRPIGNLSLLANYSYLHSEITSGCCYIDAANPAAMLYGAAARVVSTDAGGNGLQRVSGNMTPLAPSHKASLNATYTFHLPPADLSISVTENIRSKAYYTIFNTPDYLIRGSDTTDLTVAWRAKSDHYAIIGSVSNLFDEDAVQSFTTTSPQSARLQSVGFQPPRVVRVELQYRF